MTTPLHRAAAVRGDELRRLLQEGASPAVTDASGRTPLHVAARVDREHVEALLAAGADPDARDAVGVTPLHFAVSVGRWDLIEPLLAAGADPDAADQNGHTPLARAVHDRQLGAIGPLLAAGADPRRGDLTGETPLDRIHPLLGTGLIDDLWRADALLHGPDRLSAHLRQLIDEGAYWRLQRVLDPTRVAGHFSYLAQRGALPLESWIELGDELSTACQSRGAWSSLHALHTVGLPVRWPSAVRDVPWRREQVCDVPPGGVTAALMLAAWVSNGAAVPFVLRLEPDGCAPVVDAALFALLHAGQTVGSEVDDERNAFRAEALAALRSAGADLEARAGAAVDSLHRSLGLPLDAAGAPIRNAETKQAVRDLRLDWLTEDLVRWPELTPLLLAVKLRSVLLPRLLEAGADRNAVDRSGRNALHLASVAGGVRGAVETVACLLAAGFAPDAPDPAGWRPLTLASHPGILALLVQHGASPRLSTPERQLLGASAAEKLERGLREPTS